MKIIKPSVEFFGAVPTEYESALRFIEMAGRTCYRSEDRITPTSAESFVKRLIKAGHLAMVEHSNFVVRSPSFDSKLGNIGKFLNYFEDDRYRYIGGNLTAWAQAGLIKGTANEARIDGFALMVFLRQYGLLFGLCTDEFAGAFDSVADLPSACRWQVCPHDEIPKELHRYSAKFICDRGVSHELVRHRPCSFAQESTRYVNYAGKEMEFIEPTGFEEWDPECQRIFEYSLEKDAALYEELIVRGLKPQQARAVLPNALKTEIVVTADAAEWAHIRKLRTSPAAHPDIQRVMNMMPWEDFL